MSTQKVAVLLACGSFNPITYAHLRMFILAKEYLQTKFPDITLHSGIISPVSDKYDKNSLIPAKHRLEMCRLSTAEERQNKTGKEKIDRLSIVVNDWEAKRSTYSTTVEVLEYTKASYGKLLEEPVKVYFLAGGDLVNTFSNEKYWPPTDVDKIIMEFGCIAIERQGHQIEICDKWKDQLEIVPQTIQNDISSTKLRELASQSKSLRYLTPDAVCEYISDNQLYKVSK